MALHVVVGGVIFFLTLYFISKVGRKKPKELTDLLTDLADPPKVKDRFDHRNCGKRLNIFIYVLVGLGVATVVVKTIANLIPTTGTGPLWVSKITRWAHILFGYFTIGWANWTIMAGLYSFDSAIKELIFLHFFGYIFALVGMELYRFFSTPHKKFGYAEGFFAVKRKMTLEEFDQEIETGSKLVIYDGFVCDVGLYRFEHPGGRQFLERAIGKDIGQFLAGALPIAEGQKPH